MMKRTVLFLLMALHAGLVSAQSLRVSVKNELAEPLPYAYVYVNGRAAGIADTLGMVSISGEKLNLGDTLSATMIGNLPGWVVYDRTIQRQGRAELVLPENYHATIAAKEVVVHADMEDFFAKNLREIIPMWYSGTLAANFRAVFSQPGVKTRAVEGSLKVDNEIWNKNWVRPMRGQRFFGDSIRFSTVSDTAGMDRTLRSYVHWALDAAGGITGTCMTRKKARELLRREGYGFRFGYLGKENGIMKFRVPFYPETMLGDTYQQLLHIDENRKSLVKAEVSILIISNQRMNGVYNISADYVDFRYKRWEPTLMPVNIRYEYKADDGSSVEVEITHAVFGTKDPKAVDKTKQKR